MSRSVRVSVAAVPVLLGATAYLFLGGLVGRCLGPIGVTAVQCARATGVVPDVGFGLAFLALMISLATFIIAPVPAGRRLRVPVGGIVGGAIGAAAFLALRPLTMDGSTPTGSGSRSRVRSTPTRWPPPSSWRRSWARPSCGCGQNAGGSGRLDPEPPTQVGDAGDPRR